MTAGFGTRRAQSDGNMAGILAMLAAMAAFTANDVCVKLAARSLPLGEIIFLRNAFATLILGAALLFVLDGERRAVADLIRRLPHDRPLMRLLSWRLVGEVAATLLFLAALVRMRIGDVTAIMQATPLAVTAGAALLLGERVGWRRWAAAVAGLVGVLMIVRPGATAFTPAALMAVASIGFVVLRDLATRQVPPSAAPTSALTLASAASVMVSGFVLWPFETWLMPEIGTAALLALAGLFLIAAYAFIVVGMRSGEVAVVGPFRYSVIVWALVAGYVAWGDVPVAMDIAGMAVIVGAGLYTFHRERVRARTETAMVAGAGS